MTGLEIPIALGAIGLGKSIFGAAQLLGNKRPDMPTYEIPDEISEIEKILRGETYKVRLPGQDIIESNIQQNQADAIAAAKTKEGGGFFNTLSNAMQQSSDAQQNLQLAMAQQRASNVNNLVSGLQLGASYKDKAFQINELNPYAQKYGEFIDRRQAGANNIMTGLNDIGGAAMTYLKYKNINEIYDSIFGGGVGADEAAAGLRKAGQTESVGGTNSFGNAREFSTQNMFGLNKTGLRPSTGANVTPNVSMFKSPYDLKEYSWFNPIR